MTFWHNQKYEDLEKTTINGDFLRGMPAKNFPWILKSIDCVDFDNDVWQIKILCTGIESSEFSQKVKAKISLEGQCKISEENLKKMGIEFQRLFGLDLRDWNKLTEKYEFVFPVLIDKLEEKSSEFYKIFFTKIREKYRLEKKKEIVNSKIKNCRVSNFA